MQEIKSGLLNLCFTNDSIYFAYARILDDKSWVNYMS